MFAEENRNYQQQSAPEQTFYGGDGEGFIAKWVKYDVLTCRLLEGMFLERLANLTCCI